MSPSRWKPTRLGGRAMSPSGPLRDIVLELIDYLIGGRGEVDREFDAERLCGATVDHGRSARQRHKRRQDSSIRKTVQGRPLGHWPRPPAALLPWCDRAKSSAPYRLRPSDPQA